MNVFLYRHSAMQGERGAIARTRFNQWMVEQHLPANIPPSEADYLAYFTHLREIRRYAWSSIWCIYGLLKVTHNEIYGIDLGMWFNIRRSLLRQYNIDRQ